MMYNGLWNNKLIAKMRSRAKEEAEKKGGPAGL